MLGFLLWTAAMLPTCTCMSLQVSSKSRGCFDVPPSALCINMRGGRLCSPWACQAGSCRRHTFRAAEEPVLQGAQQLGALVAALPSSPLRSALSLHGPLAPLQDADSVSHRTVVACQHQGFPAALLSMECFKGHRGKSDGTWQEAELANTCARGLSCCFSRPAVWACLHGHTHCARARPRWNCLYLCISDQQR